ncbi:MAG: ribonuclease E/G [Armatimonadetes bacterium]|nr:ribonuclease E/G [Armatimonadota bacterium]
MLPELEQEITIEALTTIDVNTGKFVGTTSLNETIVRNNLEAVNEIARQLRLRDIGGIIVIDFIDMSNPKDRQQVVRSLEQALRRDRSRTKISHISPLGLVEMTRKRTAETITDFLTEPCPYCSGRGHLSSPETVSIAIEREINRQAAARTREAIMVICHPDVAEFLIGPEGATIERIEREVQCAIYIRSDAELHLEKYEIRPVELSEMERKTHSVRRMQVVECKVGRSRLSATPKAIGWMDGYLIDLNDGQKQIGQRAKVRIDEVRRSYAVATVVPGAGGRPVDKADII